MLLEYLEIGKIVSTHGVRGELRAQAWCDSYEFFSHFDTIYVGKREKKEYHVISSRPHGNIVLVTLNDVDDLDKANELRNKILFVKRADAPLPKGRYFIAELIGCKVVNSDDESLVYGEVVDVTNSGASDIWHIKQGTKEYLFPSVKEMVDTVDVEKCIAKIRPIHGIFDEGIDIRDD